MKPARFVRHAVRTMEDAISALATYAPEGGRILAGGQSLIPMMAFRLAQPTHLIDINSIDGIGRIACDGQTLSVPAGVRHAAFHRHVVDGALGGLLSVVACHIAHLPIRTRGTLCGRLANAVPASEWSVVLVALEDSVVARSLAGERVIPGHSFFRSIMTTALHDDEMLVEARLPVPAKPAHTAWVGRSMRRVEDPALVRGQGRFTADQPAAHWVHFVRSPVASGRIEAIEAPPGAFCITAADFVGVKPIRPMLHKFGYVPIAQPVLADGVVRYVGDPVAAIVADSKELAEDLAEQVSLQIDPTPPVTDARQALEADAPIVHAGMSDNVVVRAEMQTPKFDAA